MRRTMRDVSQPMNRDLRRSMCKVARRLSQTTSLRHAAGESESRASSLNSKKVMMSSSRRSSRDDVLADIDQAKGCPEIAVEQIRQLALIILDDMKAVDEP